jgi:hypothetical protein
LRRIRELLRPGGRVVLLAWGSREQPYFACTRGVVERRVAAAADPTAPDTFAFARTGRLEDVLRRAGFDDIVERSLRLQLEWRGTPEQLWQFMQDLTVSFRALARQDRALWDEITTEVIARLRPYVRGASLFIPAEVNLATAARRDGYHA